MKCCDSSCETRGAEPASNLPLRSLFVGIVWTLAANSASLGYLFTFDTSEELTRSFAESGVWPDDEYVYSDGPGLGGVPGRVDSGIHADALVFQRPLGWGTAGSLWGRTFFYYDSGKLDWARRTTALVTLGFLDSRSSRFTFETGLAYVAVALVAGEEGRQLALESKLTAVGRAVDYSSEFPLSSGWCSLSGSWTLGQTGEIDYVARLFSYGETGTGPGTEVASFAGTMRNTEIASAEGLFFGLHSGGAAPYLDNVSVIPDPSASALALLGALALCSRLRGLRRKRPGPLCIAREQR